MAHRTSSAGGEHCHSVFFIAEGAEELIHTYSRAERVIIRCSFSLISVDTRRQAMPERKEGRNHVRKSGLESLPVAPCGGGAASFNGAPSGKYTVSRGSMDTISS